MNFIVTRENTGSFVGNNRDSALVASSLEGETCYFQMKCLFCINLGMNSYFWAMYQL